ncbi:MAG: hypothetical protein ACLFTA_00900 [Candidatus Nanohaloarchaea archaeon]
MVMTLLEALTDPQVAFRTLHFVAAVVAVGAVTATDSMLIYLHFRQKFSTVLSKVSVLMSMLIWIGLFLLSATGAFLIYTNPEIADGTFFHIKMLLVTAVFINGVILNEKIYPRFQDLSDEWPQHTEEVTEFEKRAAIFGIISVIAWWTILLMVQLKPYISV